MSNKDSLEYNPEKKKKGCLFYGFIILAVIIGLGVLGIIFSPTEEEKKEMALEKEAEDAAEAKRQEQAAQEERDSAIKVTASELFDAYDNNEAAAQQRFGNKLVEVTGVIDGVELDISDDPVIKLATSNQFMSASVYLTAETKSQAAYYQKGETRSFLCKEVSEVISIPQLKDCVPLQ